LKTITQTIHHTQAQLKIASVTAQKKIPTIPKKNTNRYLQ